MFFRRLPSIPNRCALFAGICVCLATSPLLAQSPLDQLEKKLRTSPQPPEAVPSPPAEELPGPANDSTPNLTVPAPPANEGVFLGMEVESIGNDEIGVLVTEVLEQSPAWKAGLMVGDRLLGFNGEAIGGLDYFSQKLLLTKPGSTIRFIVDRNGRNLSVPVVAQRIDLAERLGTAGPPMTETIEPDIASRSWLGCSVADLSETWRRQFSIPAYRGAAVSDVVESSPAAAAGIKPGDVIIEIGGRSIEGSADLTQWLSEIRPGTAVKVSYFRGLTAKVSEIVVGSIVGNPSQRLNGVGDPQEREPRLNSAGRPNLDSLPPAEQIEYLRAEIFDMQERLLEMQRELERLQRSVGPPR